MHSLGTTENSVYVKPNQIEFFSYRMAPFNREMIQFVAKSKICVSLLFLLRLVLAQSDTTNVVQIWNCDGSNVVNGSALDRNLNIVLNSLVEYVGETGYNISSYGQNGGKIYGVAQCRGDLNASTCRVCASQARNTVREKCQHDSGSIFLEGCYLRYGIPNINSTLSDIEPKILRCDNSTNRTDARGLDWGIANLLTKLTEDAVSSGVGFSTRNGSGIYSLAQCFRALSMDQCRKCLDNGYKYFLDCPGGTTQGIALYDNCHIRFATKKFYGDAVFLPSSPSNLPVLPSGTTKGKKRPLILGLTIAGAFIVLMVGVILIWKRKVIKAQYRKHLLGYYNPSSSVSIAISQSSLNYKSRTLQTATKNFHPENKLGQGGSGWVYKGVLPDGKEIAVKRLFAHIEVSESDFFNEVNLISRVQHKNLVKLLGFSVDGIDRLLVYEYLPKKSLDQFLFDEKKGKVLDWQTRYDIILGTARGLTYLHQESEIRIIHRDIKAGNILLDQHFKPKIADFGLVRYFAEDQTHLTTGIVGTRSYVAPEYVEHGHLTEKVDVYSFGVLVLEIISGKKNIIPVHVNNMPSLLTMVWNHYLSGTLSNTIDSRIQENCQEEEVLQVIQVALLCTQASATLRPSMSKVTMFLTSKDPNLPEITQPPFIDVSSSQSSVMAEMESSEFDNTV